MEAGVTQGPLINAQGLAKVQNLVADALDNGASVAGSTANGPSGAAKLDRGYFHDAMVLRDVRSDMKIARDEIFGPVAALVSFETDEEALALANDTNAGLAAYVYTKDMASTFRFSEGLEYGMVGVNTGLISTEIAPFGGVKESGMGREGSSFGLDDYTELKYVALGGLE
jgi:succinate-semialdehyde dehydrogenase/glutarate-semialdehyde dehydrogenase